MLYIFGKHSASVTYYHVFWRTRSLIVCIPECFFSFFWSVTVPYRIDIHSVSILYPFCTCCVRLLIPVLYPFCTRSRSRSLLGFFWAVLYTVNQGRLSLSIHYSEYGRHVARLHCRRHCRRAYAPTSNTANHEKINSWVSFCFPYEYGAPLKYLIWQSSCCFLDPDTWITEFPNYTSLYIACTCTCTIKGSILEWSLVTSNA